MTIFTRSTAIFTTIVMACAFTMPAQAKTDLEKCLERRGNSRNAQTYCALHHG